MRKKKSWPRKWCDVCKEEIIRVKTKSTKEWAKARFCSKTCWSRRGKTLTKKCEECGKEFSAPTHAMKMGTERERKSCSRVCQYLLVAGKKSTMWKGSNTSYGLRFRDALSNTVMYRKWRKTIKERDGKCVNCGEIKDLMHVHHIYPLTKIIEDEGWTYERWTELFFTPKSRLWDTDNGVTLCSDCHYSLISFALQSKGFAPIQRT